MKRKSRPLITGGLLGLAGLGLLPSQAEATPDNLAVALDPSLGTALAVDPHPVMEPEPSAQTTEPQIDEQGVPQPAWTPDGNHPVVAAAATAAQQPALATAVVIPQTEPSAPAIAAVESSISEISEPAVIAAPAAVPEAPAIAPAAAPNPALVSPEPSVNTLADLPVTPAPTPAVTQAEMPEAVDSNQAAIASPSIDTPATPVVIENVADSTEAAPTVTPAEVSTKPTASKPAQVLQLPGVAPRPAIPTAVERLAATPTPIAPPPAPEATLDRPASEAVTSASSTGLQQPPNVAALRSRSTAVQALLRDLRTAYGLEIQGDPAQPVSQSETISREPQLPPLPSRANRSTSSENTAANQIPVAAPLPSPAIARQTAEREPQLPSFAGQSSNVALALPSPRPTLSTGRTALAAPPVELTAALLSADTVPVTTAQATPSSSDATQLRDSLRVAPLTTTAGATRSFPPSPNAGIPSAFGANWGDVFFSASLAGADRIRPEADGSLSMGFGLGDSRRAVGVELAYNLQSVRRFGENGGFDAKIHRQVYSDEETQVAAAVGINNFASYGANTNGSEASPYGVVTAAHLLQPEHPSNRLPITASLGLGGGAFSGESSDVGVFAGVGLQVHPQFSINTAWSGVGLNVGASIVPVTTVPLTLNLLYGDVGNNTRAGSVAVLSIGYGFNFGPRF
ncbi:MULTISPECIES: hypothetical protein [Cyanophyceae]|uniref:Outer membrane protein beta-barrel domain-containing protein n=1 Tax=Leptolyngbya subtilissima DQ-A4 TaxID=2933933 RepID=A0ABV0K5M6_9CYAN|nr:hypothetical protein [Nodosilinea sp. FACHB-141]MBD2114422.1 hypothetical protein [Nodosilinea sp. FACHB-141]